MRLIEVIAASNRHPTGMTTIFAELRDRALDRGWTFEVMIPEAIDGAGWVEEFAAHGTVVHVLRPGGIRQVSAQISAVLEARPEPALLHTHLSEYDMPAALAIRGRPDVALFWHVHSVLPEGTMRLLRTRTKFALFGRRVDRVVIPFENTKPDLVRRGAKPERIVVMPGSIDPDDYPLRSAAERSAARAAIGIPDDTRLLLHFGWHWYEKGGELFLQTVRRLVDEGVPVRALVNRGGDPAAEGIRRLGLEDVVEIGGLVEDSRSLFVPADCVLGPSRAEGMTFAYIEALSTGVPVVATNLPGERYLYDEVRACVVADHDPASLAQATRNVLSRSEEEAHEIAAEAHAWIEDNRTVERVAQGLFDEYVRVTLERETRS
jgi:glycosyltransferase involved in cell wall biosynthesis